MTINQNLDELELKINTAKQQLVINLTNKGVADITSGNTLSELADSVNNVTGGGSRDWKEIGYEKEPAYITDGYNYAKQMLSQYEKAKTVNNFRGLFTNDQKVIFIPKFKLVEGQAYDSFLAGCENAQYMEMIDFKGISSARYFLANCKSLKDIKVCNTENLSDIRIFSGCDGCKSITPFSVKSMKNISGYLPFTIHEMTLLDFGDIKLTGSVDFKIPNWGKTTNNYPNAKQSVKNTFNNAIDRNQLGLSSPTLNINLSPTTISCLTKDERLSLDKKGYTINYHKPSEDDAKYDIHIVGTEIPSQLYVNYLNWGNTRIEINSLTFDDNLAYFLPTPKSSLTDIIGIQLPSGCVEIKKLPTITYKTFNSMFNAFVGRVIDISMIDSHQVTDVTSMFAWSKCEEINMSNFDSANVQQYDSMFLMNRSLKKVTLLHCTAETIQFIKDRISEMKNDEKEPMTTPITLVTDAGEEVI